MAHSTAAALVLARGMEAAACFQPNACPTTISGTKVIEPGRPEERGKIPIRMPGGRGTSGSPEKSSITALGSSGPSKKVVVTIQ